MTAVKTVFDIRLKRNLIICNKCNLAIRGSAYATYDKDGYAHWGCL